MTKRKTCEHATDSEAKYSWCLWEVTTPASVTITKWAVDDRNCEGCPCWKEKETTDAQEGKAQRIAALEAQVAEAWKLARRLGRMFPRIYERLDNATARKIGISLYTDFWECGKKLNNHLAAIDAAQKQEV